MQCEIPSYAILWKYLPIQLIHIISVRLIKTENLQDSDHRYSIL